MWRAGVAAAIILANAAFASIAVAQADEDSTSLVRQESWLIWHTKDFFSSCNGNCAFAVYGGREVTTNMTSVFLLGDDPVAPWHARVGNAGIIAGNFSRRVLTMLNMIDLEAEIGIGQRFGDMHATEGWVAVDFRWTYFPWNQYVRTTIALAEGGSYASEIDLEERRRADNNKGSNYLNFFSPEMTFALPDMPNDELLFRFQHRSGVFGLINGVYGGSSFATVGYRHRF